MANPIYKGSGQPVASSGWLSGLGSWFGGGSTPAYAGAGQPSATSSGYLGGSTPAYKPASSSTQDVPSFAIVIPRDLIDTQQ